MKDSELIELLQEVVSKSGRPVKFQNIKYKDSHLNSVSFIFHDGASEDDPLFD